MATYSSTSQALLLISQILLVAMLVSSSTDNAGHLFDACIDEHGNYTTNSTYHANLNTLLSSLADDSNAAARDGFYSSSRGQNPDRVYATAFCRGDAARDECLSCVNESRHFLPRRCPNQKSAVVWYHKCTLRYSDRYLEGVMNEQPAFMVYSKRNMSSIVDEYDRRLTALLEGLRVRVVDGTDSDSFPKFAAGHTGALEGVAMYGLMQCSPDLSASDCNDCVVQGAKFLKEYCYGSHDVFMGLPSCNVVYGFDRFFDSAVDEEIQSLSSIPPLVPPESQPTNERVEKKKKSGKIAAIIVVLSVSICTVLLISICFYLRVRRTKKKLETGLSNRTDEEESKKSESLQFDFHTIRSATNNFSEENKLGQGGFGTVYKGRLSNGQDIAVKRHHHGRSSKQRDLEFKNEVLLVAKLGHRNLVSLLGFALENKERVLVYEFMPNSSLDHFIFDLERRERLAWNTRYKIILGIARGLLYLHEESRLKIIHRDLKAGNVLLDAEMNPKISDFGTARLFALNQTKEKTKRIAGTYGYMAPEYARSGEFSVKSDVYSFGVLVLEIICGQRVKDFGNGEKIDQRLLSYAWENWKQGKAMNLVDPRMRAPARHEIIRCVHIGLLCVQEKIADRPTMGSVVLMLNSYSVALRRPSQPAYFTTKPNQFESNSDHISENCVTLSELSPR